MAANSSQFVAFVVECLQPLGPVSVRRMFGGHGIFLDGLMFGLIADDRLYLKVDDGNRAAYQARGLEPFRYARAGKERALSYHEAPPEGLDDPEVLSVFGRDAYAAALRGRKPARLVATRRQRSPATTRGPDRR